MLTAPPALNKISHGKQRPPYKNSLQHLNYKTGYIHILHILGPRNDKEGLGRFFGVSYGVSLGRLPGLDGGTGVFLGLLRLETELRDLESPMAYSISDLILRFFTADLVLLEDLPLRVLRLPF